MILARVLGHVVATVKHSSLKGQKLLTLQPLDGDGKDAGEQIIAIDLVQSGPGDRVLVLREGSGVRQLLGNPEAPIRSAIVGIVDSVERSQA